MAALPVTPTAIRGLLDVEIKDTRWAGPRSLRQLAYALRRGTLMGPEPVAVATAKILEPIAKQAQYDSLEDLVVIIRTVGTYLQRVQPNEQSIGNVVRRALHQLREDAIEEGIVSQKTAEGHAATSGPVSVASSSSLPEPSGSDAQNQKQKAQTGRPSLGHFRPGSTFSISDLVAAGAGAGASTGASRSTTTAASKTHTGEGSTVVSGLASSIGQLSMHDTGSTDSGQRRHVGEASAASNTLQSDDESKTESSDDEQIEGSISQLSSVLIGVAEKLIEDIRMAPAEAASKFAANHIHSGEVIMTMGYSQTVEQFLKSASRQRQFTVIVAESAPDFGGHRMAKVLTEARVHTILVPDTSIAALISRVSKVLVGAQLILADGGLLVAPGVRLLAEIACLHQTPTLVLAGAYKLCPDPAWLSAGTWLHGGRHDPPSDSELPALIGKDAPDDRRALDGPPEEVLAVTAAESTALKALSGNKQGSAGTAAAPIISNPSIEYLGPDGYDLLITNTGEHAVSLVHLLVAQNYDRQDLVL